MTDKTPAQTPPRASGSALKSMRGNFLAGLVVAAPIAITLYLTWQVVQYVDAWILPLLPGYVSRWLPAGVPGFGLVFFFIFTAMLGWFAKKVAGKQLLGLGEAILERMPIVRTIYTALKQIAETIFTQGSAENSFREVCMIEYPKFGIWAIAFVTASTRGEIPVKIGEPDMISVFLPTTPNPTSGFLLYVPRKSVRILSMSVEDAAKLIISAGLVTPSATLAANKAPKLLSPPQRRSRSLWARLFGRRRARRTRRKP